MNFVSNKQKQIQEMLGVIGVATIEDLFDSIPLSLKLSRPSVDDGISEYEAVQLMEALAKKNSYASYENYLGAGAYEHHIPSLVPAICSRSEFLTSYTPYQAEASQGVLQSIFEFQSAICALTGMDVANASVYDGASACAEGLLMASRVHKERRKILLAETLHPHYRKVVDQYLQSHHFEVHTIPRERNGQLQASALQEMLDQNTIAVLLQSPNFLGILEEVASLSPAIKASGALLLLCANPLSYGIYASARELQVDIAMGDCQVFGLPLQFGGPYVGYLACRQEFVRQLPGRLVGKTVDTKGRPGFVLTLQTREQHIRREKATSNICTNQALAALANLIAMLWYGRKGVQELALANFQRASYLKDRLSQLSGVEIVSEAPIFNEFVVRFKAPLAEVQVRFRAKGIEPGIPLENFFPNLKNCLLIAVTETKTKEQLDRYIEAAQ